MCLDLYLGMRTFKHLYCNYVRKMCMAKQKKKRLQKKTKPTK